MDVARSLVWLGSVFLLLSCAEDFGPDKELERAAAARHDGGAFADAGSAFGNANRDLLNNIPDAALVSLNPDAFFINDPLPPICAEDGSREEPSNPGGTPDCPDDKNRAGCLCPDGVEVGDEQPCWPGKRANRNHGICRDGVTRCINSPEFGKRWGDCDGYVLPVAGALSGPEACSCFSEGKWALTNLAPCIYEGTSVVYLYSSWLNSSGQIQCDTVQGNQPAVSDMLWSESVLNVDCTGRFELCFSIKAGDRDNPRPEDCTIMTTCVETWYEEANVDQPLPDLPAWSSERAGCARDFVENGGYGEMTVLGLSVECDEVDDGLGNPYVFHRTRYCPTSCLETPDTPECKPCQTGGSGQFGP